MSKEETVFLTAEGYIELEEELNDLKLNKRPEIVQAIKEARAQGDLSENADYDAARNEQAQLEGRIRELEYTLEHAQIVDKVNKNKVNVGCLVTIEYVADAEEDDFKIVGSLEADPLENKISNESPIGKAIIGLKVGDIASVSSPNGDYKVKVVKIA